MKHDILIIALEYLEPEWQATFDCIRATGCDYVIAKRDGVGNMSRAFNEAVIKAHGSYKYLWFVTNVTFKPDLPEKLISNIGKHAAIHPSFTTSDHSHLHPCEGVKEVPYIEFTAPLFKSIEFIKIGMLDTELWHYYMDLDICARLRQQGKTVAVDGENSIGHVYLRNGKKHEITKIREQLRNIMAIYGKKHMEMKWGKDWRNTVWHNIK